MKWETIMIKAINNLRQYLHTFMYATKGSIAVIFAMMIPVFFIFMAYYFDSVQLVAKQARLSDAVDEGTLAISSRGWGEERNQENIDILHLYLNDYLPEAKAFSDVDVKLNDPMNGCLTRYYTKAKAEINMSFHFENWASFNPTELVAANSKACIRAETVRYVGDFAFLIDLSSSMTEDMPDKEGKKQKKLDVLKNVVTNMIATIMRSSDDSKFALVPFNLGVPVKLEGTTEAGSDLFGCSVAFTPKADFDIDYAYWANKYIPPETESLSKAVNLVDNARFEYYSEYIVGNGDDDTTLNDYCSENKQSGGASGFGQAPYSCVANMNRPYEKNARVGSQGWYNNNSMLYYDPNLTGFINIYQCVDTSFEWASCVESMISPDVSRKIHPTFVNEWQKAMKARIVASQQDPNPKFIPGLTSNSLTEFKKQALLYRNIVNDESIDYEKTLENMFNESSIKTFAMPLVYRRDHTDDNEVTKNLRPYHWMCPSIPGGYRAAYGSEEEAEYAGKKEMRKIIRGARMNHYLVGLTRFCGSNAFLYGDALDQCDNSKTSLEVIETIDVPRNVRTDTMTGLLRAIPVIAHSKNNFKSIIIVSDGADNVNLALSKKMLTTYQICDRIRSGFKLLNEKNEVGLYMVFTSSDSLTDPEIIEHVQLWKDCVGENNFYLATSVDALESAIKDILNKTHISKRYEMASFISDDK